MPCFAGENVVTHPICQKVQLPCLSAPGIEVMRGTSLRLVRHSGGWVGVWFGRGHCSLTTVIWSAKQRSVKHRVLMLGGIQPKIQLPQRSLRTRGAVSTCRGAKNHLFFNTRIAFSLSLR